MNSLLHDTDDRIRWARHPETVVSNHGLIRLTVSHNLVKQNITWDGLIAPLEISQNPVIQNFSILEMSQQSPIPKRKRTTHSNIELHKRRWSTKLNLAQRMSVNPQDSTKKPTEPSKPVSMYDSESEPEEQCNFEPEPEEKDNSEPESKEEIEQGKGCHSESEPREEANSKQEPKEEDRLDLE